MTEQVKLSFHAANFVTLQSKSLLCKICLLQRTLTVPIVDFCNEASPTTMVHPLNKFTFARARLQGVF